MRKATIIKNQKKQIEVMIDDICDSENEVDDLKGQLKIKDDLIQRLINAIINKKGRCIVC